MRRKTGPPSRATRLPTTTRSRRTKAWVNKTDLVRYIRCPYAFWLLDQGLVEFADTVDEAQAHLIAKGHRFQKGVEATATAVTADNLPALLAEPATRLDTFVAAQLRPETRTPLRRVTSRGCATSVATASLVASSSTPVQRCSRSESASPPCRSSTLWA